MKKHIITIITVGIVTQSVFVPISFAQTVTPTLGPRAQKIEELQQSRITDLKTRADAEITRRITSLSSLVTRLGNIKHLTAAQVSSFTNEVNTEISNLTALKTKIDADTDLQTLRIDVQSIIKSYRVYALFLPQINLLDGADRALNVIGEFSALITKLQQRIQEAQNAGQNVSALQTSLQDMQSKITDATSQAQAIISSVSPLTPDGYPGNKTTLQSARGMMKVIYQDFVEARSDAKTIIQGLKLMKQGASPVPSVSPTPTQ